MQQPSDPATAGTSAQSPQSSPDHTPARDSESASTPQSRARRRKDGLSYKFQRLREKLRKAIVEGEFSGKLPGERTLARRFFVNAKTLSKALTDLAAEGLLDRSIGRGTYVRGSTPEPAPAAADKWLLICDADQLDAPIVKQLQAANPEAQAIVV